MIVDLCLDVAEAVKAVRWRLKHHCKQCKNFLPMLDCETAEVRCYGLCAGCGQKTFDRLGHWPAVMMEQPACKRFEKKHTIVDDYGLPFAE